MVQDNFTKADILVPKSFYLNRYQDGRNYFIGLIAYNFACNFNSDAYLLCAKRALYELIVCIEIHNGSCNKEKFQEFFLKLQIFLINLIESINSI